MGRILRKKLINRPKKAEGDQTASVPQNGNGTSEKSVSSAAVARQSVKTPVNYPGKRHVDAAVQFLREVRVELRKVTWPSRKQTIGSTVVVIVLVLMLSIFLGLVDVGLSSIVNAVLQ